MRGKWILFLLLLALVISAGVGTANLMWGRPPHVAVEASAEDVRPVEAQADTVWRPLEVSSDEGAD